MRIATLKTSRQFKRVYSVGKAAADGLFVLKAAQGDPGNPPLVGVCVSRKVGNAVKRNKIRRRVFEIWRGLCLGGFIKPGVEAVFIARPAAADADFSEIRRSVMKLLLRQRIV